MVGVFGLLTARRMTLAFAALVIVAGLAGRLAVAAESQGPSASFTFTPGSAQTGETISFTSTSSDDGTIIAEEWDFDDGSAGSGQQVDHDYAIPGVYNVSLTVTDDETLNAVETHTVTIDNRNPTADFHYSPGSPLPDQTVQFTSDATDPENRIDVVRWDFDNDGQFDATGTTVATSFSAPGSHTVVLKVEDQDGGTDTISKTVDVADPPNQLPLAGFNFSPGAPFVLQNVSFTSTATDPGGSIALKEWDFEDDGTYDASGQQVSHAYLFAGDYTVRQRVTDNEGATAEITKVVSVGTPPNDPPTASFTVSPGSPKTLEDVMFTSTSTDDGTIVTYGWELDGDNDFDDRLGPSFSSIFSPAGQYTITLKVIDEDGASATESKTITIANRQPTADFEFTPVAPQKNENVAFTSLSSDPENRIDKLEWDLDGDNQYNDAIGPTAQTSFGSPGNKTVRLKVTDLDGGSHTVSKTVAVANKPPTAAFVFSPDAPLSLQRVTFTSTASDTDGAISDVRWDLDNDGAFDDSSDIEASRIFDTAGNKTVRLRVTDDDGNQATTSHVVPVTNRAPSAVIDAPTAAEKNVDIVIKSISTDLDGSIASTQWDTDGDGYDDGTGSQITKRFASTGPKTIKVKVTDNLGATDEDTHVIDIGGNTAPVAGFNVAAPNPLLTGVIVTFTSTSTDSDGSVASLAWDLDGDGNFDDGSKSPITRTFVVPGPQAVALRVTDNEGATDVIQKTVSVNNRAPTAIVSASPPNPLSLDQVTFTSTATDPDGTIASRQWDLDNDGQFDDGLGVSLSQAFPKKGTYTVKVKVTDDFGASATGTAQVTVQNRVPLATFTHGPASPNPRDAVTMTSTSLDLDGLISLIEWDTDNDGAFDDGTGPTASRTFTTSGIKTARLRVTDNDGGQTVGSQTIVVGNRPPIASFDYRPAAPVVDQPVTFFSTADDPDKNIESVEWDLDGDGGFETSGSTTSRQFPAGSFNISMRVTDTEGSFAIVTQTIVVGVPPAPKADTGARLRSLSPFPLVRMAGRIGRRGTRLRLLTVDAPTGSTVTVRCSGRSCPFKKSTRAASTGKLVSAARQVHIRKLEKRLLRVGVLIKIYVTKAGTIGKFTSIKIRKGKPPKRTDRCLMPGDTKPVQCPS